MEEGEGGAGCGVGLGGAVGGGCRVGGRTGASGLSLMVTKAAVAGGSAAV